MKQYTYAGNTGIRVTRGGLQRNAMAHVLQDHVLAKFIIYRVSLVECKYATLYITSLGKTVLECIAW